MVSQRASIILILYISGPGSVLKVENSRQKEETQTFKHRIPCARHHVRYEKTSNFQFLQSPYKV